SRTQGHLEANATAKTRSHDENSSLSCFSCFRGCVARTRAILEKRMNGREERETERVKHRREDEGGRKDRARSETGQPDEEGEQHCAVPPESLVLAGRERQPQVRHHEPT